MSIVNLITKEESDTFNATYPEWLALTDELKEAHIFNASLYMQNAWSCIDVVWEDPETLNDTQKLACARYAEADRKGLLFTSMDDTDTASRGRIIEETKKLSSLQKTIRWSEKGKDVSTNPLNFMNSLMMQSGCSLVNSATIKAERV